MARKDVADLVPLRGLDTDASFVRHFYDGENMCDFLSVPAHPHPNTPRPSTHTMDVI